MGAGAPMQVGILREQLFDWFCLLHWSVHGRIQVPSVLQKVVALVKDCIVQYARRCVQDRPPSVSLHWLRDWCAETEYARQEGEAKLQSMHAVLEQVQAIGRPSLEAQVRKAIHAEERKLTLLCRAHPEVTEGFLLTREDDRRRARRKHISIRQAVAAVKRLRVSIKKLAEEEDKLRQLKLELLQASTVVECKCAVKSWDMEDLGQGHDGGGTKKHKQNRMAILERLRVRAKPLPPELANDWHWFLRHWEDARIRRLVPSHRAGWASIFRDLVQGLMRDMRTDDNAFASWMRRERGLLRAPIIRV